MADAVPTVLVTGASGYIATHIVQQLQQSGLYKVRGTVRSIKNEAKIALLKNLCPSAKYPLELVEADLTDEKPWRKAVEGCTYVLHTASPFPLPDEVENEDKIVKPAVDGTLNVLRACRSVGGLKRVILTSSGVAIEGASVQGRKVTENDWTDVTAAGVTPYSKSKTLAEKAAWDFVKELSDAERFELVVLNPTLVTGPVLCGSITTSQQLPKRLLEGEWPVVPPMSFNVIDVRDVAKAHINAMTVPEAVGNRHLLFVGYYGLIDLAKILADEFKPQGYDVTTTAAPNPPGQRKIECESDRMTKVLGITPISIKQSVIDMTYSMIESGKIKKTSGYRGPPA